MQEKASASASAAVGGGGDRSMAEAEEKRVGVGEARAPLAVEALRGKIVEKVKGNRVTLIVGDTGCGNRTDCSLPPPVCVCSSFDSIRSRRMCDWLPWSVGVWGEVFAFGYGCAFFDGFFFHL